MALAAVPFLFPEMIYETDKYYTTYITYFAVCGFRSDCLIAYGGYRAPAPTANVKSEGFYDSQTEAAVTEMQRLLLLPANGITNIPTWQGISAAANNARLL